MPPSLSVRIRQESDITVPEVKSQPPGGVVADVLISLIAVTVLVFFITKRALAIKNWKKVPFLVWGTYNASNKRNHNVDRWIFFANGEHFKYTVVLGIFVDSWLFVFITGILKYGVDLNSSYAVCSAALFLCLTFYMTAKIYVVRNDTKPRLKSKLYIFNTFVVIILYLVVAIVNLIYRITRIDDGVCIIGMQRGAMVALLGFDTFVNMD
ncbi:hypothetical protein PFICI_15013 [Pestalotiopsis fici W106-1]|uniref:Uncharacterized protein n=1 Tax=Pestalotiopsis fici (strain W106-1 / CGMCC3.15140) TaxID=1229662 RepID=W3WHN7_PESFW|nr:uncharacterized protein PFICI_15013 [Pestalotiopsis fici W106-1]ETS73408.1 hypothetical protein PFICI_15013 [Pestalotiopsis fici W106-1]